MLFFCNMFYQIDVCAVGQIARFAKYNNVINTMILRSPLNKYGTIMKNLVYMLLFIIRVYSHRLSFIDKLCSLPSNQSM